MKGDDLAEALTDGLGDAYHVSGFGAVQAGLAVALPKAEPGLEVAFLQMEVEVFEGHGAAVVSRATGDAGPEVGDFFQVGGPVVNVGGEDGADLAVLAHVGVEIAEQRADRRASADAIEERGDGGGHVAGSMVATMSASRMRTSVRPAGRRRSVSVQAWPS